MYRYAQWILLILIISPTMQAKGKLGLITVNESDGIIVPQSGLLDSDSVRQILSVLTNKAELSFLKIMLEKKSEGACIKIKPLGKNVKGVHTGQLFAISVKESCLVGEGKAASDKFRPLYILKESKKGVSEIKNLVQMRKSSLNSRYVSTEQRLADQVEGIGYEMARVTFEDVHFILHRHHQGMRYFSLLQTAPGKSFQEHLRVFGEQMLVLDRESQEYYSEIARMKHIFYRVGFALSKLHQQFARESGILGKSYTHGDLHAQNLFYDDETEDVSLIDNETFCFSLKKRTSGINDIVDLYLLHSVKTVAHQFSNLLTNVDLNIDDDLWHELWGYLFLGYLEAYENFTEAEKIIAFEQFKHKFIASLSSWQVFDSVRNFKDQRMLKRVGPSTRRMWLKEKRIHETFRNVHDEWLKIERKNI